MSKRYWFKTMRYGYGWTPTTWEGWTVSLFLGVVLIWGAIEIKEFFPRHPFSALGISFIWLCLVGMFMSRILAEKGPAGRWRWGWKDTDNPDEDL